MIIMCLWGEFCFILDDLLLDIFKDSGEMGLELSFLEDSVLSRTGCSFIALHNKVLSQEMDFESLGSEDFILNMGFRVG